ncbi:hypothetical protein BSK66_32235 [Paenibacillus odorifer]|uniref:hypothetical protein n=1 Tax=Paenibacillus TaxID=44249 RepID=UPI0003E1CFEE|nr:MULTISPECIES: hypothetical protein [Paenibacillus]ETT53034.1 hypothetical protein C171_21289 [Paenibacillus sp. FSL H8-237]OMD07472.1 hypothetical protein BJP47_30340 [Paenibacillus odorifer]OME46222.1 hypothetical protein BSK66_32235 [Paenibacillus odorifer]
MWIEGAKIPRLMHEWDVTSIFSKSEKVKYQIELHKHRQGDEPYGVLTTRSDGEITYILDSRLCFPTEEEAQIFITARKEQILAEPELPNAITISYPDKQSKRRNIVYFYFKSDYMNWKEHNGGLEFTEIM